LARHVEVFEPLDRAIRRDSNRPLRAQVAGGETTVGAHIENSRTPFVDYPEGTTWQPDEHALELGRAHLLELRDALTAMAPGIERRALRDFTIWPVAE
jgi:hypothetical protein